VHAARGGRSAVCFEKLDFPIAGNWKNLEIDHSLLFTVSNYRGFYALLKHFFPLPPSAGSARELRDKLRPPKVSIKAPLGHSKRPQLWPGGQTSGRQSLGSFVATGCARLDQNSSSRAPKRRDPVCAVLCPICGSCERASPEVRPRGERKGRRRRVEKF